jgi:hypothetical protein
VTSLQSLFAIFFTGLFLAALVIVGAFLAEMTDLGTRPEPIEPSTDFYWLQLHHAQAADRATLEETRELPGAPETEAAIRGMHRWMADNGIREGRA